MSETNWGGNVHYRSERVVAPSSDAEFRALVAGAAQVSAVASRHSFNAIGDGDVLVDLSRLARPATVDREAGTVDVTASSTYAELCAVLDESHRALPNLASLPHISVAGAVATGTHGSGSDLGCLATAVEEIEMVTGAGDVITLRRGDDGFDGAVVGLGSLGIVTRVTVRTEPAYDVAQTVHDGLGWDVLTSDFDDVFTSATSVSVFTQWRDEPCALWRKNRTDRLEPDREPFGTTPATGPRHPVPGESPDAVTPQLGDVGPWWARLPHFRADAVPSTGSEIQSEMFVDRADSSDAIAALRSIGHALAPVLHVGEIRTVAADALWMSPFHERDSTAFHFTWKLDPPAVARAVNIVAEALEPFDARPHPGKALPDRWHSTAARLDDYLALKESLDPTGTFTTPWFRHHVM